MNTTLVIMAAGIGSRFGTGIKQLAKMNANGEIIMDYSVYDAKAAGFNKVVFVIRRDIEKEFKEVIGDRISQFIDVAYVYQELTNLPEGFTVPEGRTKPWGTGQAVLACKDVVKEPFVIINADDYYGKEAFVKLHDFLISHQPDEKKHTMALAGFVLEHTFQKINRGIIYPYVWNSFEIDSNKVFVESAFGANLLEYTPSPVIESNSISEIIKILLGKSFCFKSLSMAVFKIRSNTAFKSVLLQSSCASQISNLSRKQVAFDISISSGLLLNVMNLLKNSPFRCSAK